MWEKEREQTSRATTTGSGILTDAATFAGRLRRQVLVLVYRAKGARGKREPRHNKL